MFTVDVKQQFKDVKQTFEKKHDTNLLHDIISAMSVLLSDLDLIEHSQIDVYPLHLACFSETQQAFVMKFHTNLHHDIISAIPGLFADLDLLIMLH